MSHRHLRTLDQVFQHPPAMNVHWREIVRMFEALGGEVDVGHAGRQTVRLNGEQATFSIPHGKAPQSKSQIMAIRHFLERAGIGPDGTESRPESE